MRRTSRVVVLTGFMLSLLAIRGFASTVAPPRNIGALAKVSKAVVFAEVVREWNEVHGTVPYTVTAFRTVQEVKGQVRGTFELQEQGGIAGTVGVSVLGAAKFEKGGRYLLFLEPAADGQRWQTKMLAYGILREDKETGTLRPLPQAADLQIVERPGVEAIGTYREKELLQLLGAVASGASPWYREAVEIKPLDLGLEKTTGAGIAGAALKAAPAACQYVISPDGYPTRWTTFETGGSLGVWHTTPGQVGIADGGVSAVQEAAAAWKNPVSSVVNINYAGSKARSTTCAGNTAFAPNNEVVFNDPCNDVPELAATCEGGSTTPPGWTSPCCGQVARFLTYSDMSQLNNHDGETWRPILGMSVVVNNGAQCVGETDFKEVMTHFVGHGVGFGHHNDPEATMYGQLGVHASRGATLGQTDLICAEADYHTFLDVPYSTASFWNYIEAIENAGITLGCAAGYYCPDNQIQRAEMAVFLVRATHGAAFVPPPATGTTFADVAADYWAAPHIEQLYRDGLTNGCGTNPLRFCPTGTVTRAEMATFLTRAKYGVNYVPPAAQGVFQDVPVDYWAAGSIEQMYRDGVTNGCSATGPQYCPASNVVRWQMAKFLAVVFNLPLPQ